MTLRLLKLTIALVLLCCLTVPTSLTLTMQPAAAESLQNLEQKRRNTQKELQRIKMLKKQIMQKERYVTSNILTNQKRLDESRSSMQAQQDLLNETKTKLKQLETELDIAIAEQQKLADEVGKRLRSLYMGERLSFMHMLLDAGDLSTMLDRMYYKRRIFEHDKRLYTAYLEKTQVLEERKNALADQKNRLAQTIQRIETYQSQLRESMVLDKLLVEKLKTSREAYEMAENQLEQESYKVEQAIVSATRKGGAVVGSTGQFIRPVVASITSNFGYRVHPIFKSRRFHSGTDFGAPTGTPVRAADGGTILSAGWQGGYGKAIIINHGAQGGQNLSTLYAHLSRIAVSSGQSVSKGQVIGYVGSTGYSTGPHLHFEVRQNGRPVNPLGFLN